MLEHRIQISASLRSNCNGYLFGNGMRSRTQCVYAQNYPHAARVRNCKDKLPQKVQGGGGGVKWHGCERYLSL